MRADGPSYAAGLRDGQWLRSAKVLRNGETIAAVGIQNLPDETVHVLHDRPLGAPLTRRAVSLKPDLTGAGRTECPRLLARVQASAEVPSPVPPNRDP